MPDRPAQLEALRANLLILVALLRLDVQCQWTPHFESGLSHAERLAGDTRSQRDIDALSGSVRRVFGGMGSFNDYAPWRTGQVALGMETFDAASGAVYDAALELRRSDA